MKNFNVLCFVLTFFAFHASQAQISGGVKGGLNFTNQKWKLGLETQNDNTKIGVFLGGYANIGISESFSVQPELLFSSMGSKAMEGKYSLGYITLPVLVRYDINKLLNVQLGPQVGFLMSGKYNKIDIRDSYQKIDWGAMLGVGASFDALEAGIRYYQGFYNTYAEYPDDIKLTNSSIQLFVSYRIFGEARGEKADE
jgi:hypothetical protein